MNIGFKTKAKPPRTAAATNPSGFRDDESGGMIIFSLYIFALMLLIGGLAVDMMRLETTRTKVQGTLDRAVLAAADLDQTLSPVAVVQDYFNKAGMLSYLKGTPVVTSGLNYRTVSAQAEAPMTLLFSRMMNPFISGAPVPQTDLITVSAGAKATEVVAKVEISLVVDISGSMASNSKIQNLRSAAKTFVGTVLTPSNINRVSVSLVPYSEHVNIGPSLYNLLNKTTRHNYSHCVEIPDSQFSSAALNTSYTFLQAQHYQWNYSGSNDTTNTVCPRDTFARIRPWTQSAGTLTTQIDQLQPRAGTSIFLGMKWGTALLDPSTRSLATSLIASGTVPTAFAGRPADYSDNETIKTVVLMTDGVNDFSNRIQNWAYDSTSEYAHWDQNNFWWFMYNYVSYYQRSGYYQQYYTPTQGDNLTEDICDAAKAAGIIVWTVAFETTAHGEEVMENCASSPSHFFAVSGTDITTAFSTIAGQINNLKLTN